ncbi:MAG: hypothetical protein LBT82_01720 [Oscillospiraceae bacterium]|jgi:hypothetical protein|nr:hypothetical protein [Oscillospiraceae bacterium]
MKKIIFLKLTIYLLLILLFSTSFTNCRKSDNENKEENTRETQNYDDIKEKKSQEDESQEKNAISKTYSKIIGNLDLSKDEKDEIMKLLTKIMNLKQENVSANEEKISKLNKDLCDLLNKYTLEKFEGGNTRLNKLKSYASLYKDVSQNVEEFFNITTKSPVFLIKRSKIEPFDRIAETEYKKNNKIKNAWENVKKILPIERVNKIKYFKPFGVENKTHTAGYITTAEDSKINDANQFVLGINVGLDCDILSYSLIHEFGHFTSLNSSQRDGKYKDVFSYKDAKFKENSYINLFYKKFWEEIDEINKEDESVYLFYIRHSSEFVSMYSSLNYVEDFAETFGHFVINNYNDSDGVKEKMTFLNTFPEIVKIKNEILSLCKQNNIHPSSKDTK